MKYSRKAWRITLLASFSLFSAVTLATAYSDSIVPLPLFSSRGYYLSFILLVVSLIILDLWWPKGEHQQLPQREPAVPIQYSPDTLFQCPNCSGSGTITTSHVVHHPGETRTYRVDNDARWHNDPWGTHTETVTDSGWDETVYETKTCSTCVGSGTIGVAKARVDALFVYLQKFNARLGDINNEIFKVNAIVALENANIEAWNLGIAGISRLRDELLTIRKRYVLGEISQTDYEAKRRQLVARL
jgi:hypothetical protein